MDILCFFAGTAFFYLKNSTPLIFLGTVLFFRPTARYIRWFLAALLWCLAHEWIITDTHMPSTLVIPRATLQGHIASIPTKTPSKTQFLFAITSFNGHPASSSALLSCYNHCKTLHVGEAWLLQAKLKKPVNLANPGGFDYVGWIASRHIHWVGYVIDHSFKPLPENTSRYPLTQAREHLAHRLEILDPNEETLGVFEALTLGLTRHIDKTQWDLFRRTGTTHLIDISGEHIALVAGLSYGLFKWLWRHLGHFSLYYPAQRIASALAIFISFSYTLIAGFAVPTQRSLITGCLMLMTHFRSKRFSTWQAFRYALLLVLLLEPHAVFMLGFYFSFAAVAILIIVNQRVKQTGIRKLLALQIACLIGLMPLSLYWFSYGSITGLVANLLAIPWVGFLIVPLALFIAALSPWFVIPGSVALLKMAIMILLIGLRWIDSFEWMNITFTFTDALAPLAIMGALALLITLPLKRGLPALCVLLIACLFPNYPTLRLNEVTMDVLDVGQGLAVVIKTAHHVLLYDTGMKFYQGSDMGQLVIIPYLRTLGVKQLDTVVISHPDLDHRGGLTSLQAAYPIDTFIVDDPTYYHKGLSCHQHPAWLWDGVTFQFFPISRPLPRKNNHSCVLQIRASNKSILLSGDIEKPAESYLIQTYGKQLESTVMLIPHHGSRTSSSLSFVKQVAPRYAVASYGFDNRYHFPHNNTLATYARLQIPLYNTQHHGMIHVELTQKEVVLKPYTNRS